VSELRTGFSPSTDHKNMRGCIFIFRKGICGIDEKLNIVPENTRRAFRECISETLKREQVSWRKP
jgi:hypothetical protein